MKLKSLKNIKTTFAHNEVPRKALLRVGETKTKIQTVNYAWLKPAQSFSPHKHNDCEELYFFLEGEGEMKIDNKTFSVKKGDFVVIEKGEWHSLRNNNKKKIVFLTIRVKI